MKGVLLALLVIVAVLFVTVESIKGPKRGKGKLTLVILFGVRYFYNFVDLVNYGLVASKVTKQTMCAVCFS